MRGRVPESQKEKEDIEFPNFIDLFFQEESPRFQNLLCSRLWVGDGRMNSNGRQGETCVLQDKDNLKTGRHSSWRTQGCLRRWKSGHSGKQIVATCGFRLNRGMGGIVALGRIKKRNCHYKNIRF